MKDSDAILDFWIGTLRDDGTVPEATYKRWWQKDLAFDAKIRDRFGALLERAARGELDGWCEAPAGRVALVILLDQFSRNVHRDTARAFANDARALGLSLEGIERGEHLDVPPLYAYFLIMPMMHAENVVAQNQAVALFHEMAERVSAPELTRTFETGAEYARRHRDIVVRFGRFPHRNAILGRESTAEEAEFLTQPGSSF